MDNTIYSATTGMLARQKAMNITGNNIANLETNGFKCSEATYDTFGNYLTYKKGDDPKQIGSTNHGVLANELYTNFEQGPISGTDNMLDFALNGNGFFTVMSPDGQTMLTRDGKFTVDQNGFLTDLNGNFVMGQNGQINVGSTNFSVDEQGNISFNGAVSDSFLITVPDNTDGINMLSNGLLSFNGGAGVYTGKVLQGCLEKSNVNLVDEMTAMMKDSRAFQACGQMVKAEDELMKKTVSEIARL